MLPPTPTALGVGKSKEPHGGPARPAKRVLAFTQDGNQTCASAGGKESLLKSTYKDGETQRETD